MPTYQYACTDCGRPLEAVQKFTDDALTECPTCSGKLRKVFSAVGVVFKGSGFYRTDSRAKSSAVDAGSSSSTKSGESSSAESKSSSTESKPKSTESASAAKKSATEPAA